MINTNLEDKLNEFAKEIAKKYELPIPTIELTSRFKLIWGKCNIRNCHIKLNRYFCENNEFQVVYDLLKHEMAHLDKRTYNDRHGKIFQLVCAEMSIAHRTYIEHPDYVAEKGKYKYMCPGCNTIYYAFRPWKRNKSCRICSNGKYNVKFKLVNVTKNSD